MGWLEFSVQTLFCSLVFAVLAFWAEGVQRKGFSALKAADHVQVKWLKTLQNLPAGANIIYTVGNKVRFGLCQGEYTQNCILLSTKGQFSLRLSEFLA